MPTKRNLVSICIYVLLLQLCYIHDTNLNVECNIYFSTLSHSDHYNHYSFTSFISMYNLALNLSHFTYLHCLFSSAVIIHCELLNSTGDSTLKEEFNEYKNVNEIFRLRLWNQSSECSSIVASKNLLQMIKDAF